MEARATAKYIRIAPRKVRMLADLIRGKRVEEAINLLHFTPKRASVPVEKVVRSAVSNAMNKAEGANIDPEDLYISEIQVNEGPTMRRYKPGAMGRAGIIRKRSSHIHVVVTDKARKN
ncbi:50S ribosomal protein L22 [bacterium]|nr:50S ribosomal protein L22 [bacterium]